VAAKFFETARSTQAGRTGTKDQEFNVFVRHGQQTVTPVQRVEMVRPKTSKLGTNTPIVSTLLASRRAARPRTLPPRDEKTELSPTTHHPGFLKDPIVRRMTHPSTTNAQFAELVPL
jgi:hypothetical protein